MTDFPTGNTTRDGVILTVLKEAMAAGDPITFANIGLQCDQYGDRLDEPTRSAFRDTWAPLSEAEFTAAFAFVKGAEPATAIADKETPAVELAHPEPEMTRDEAMGLVAIASDNVLAARQELASARQAQKSARAALASAVRTWQAGGRPPMTQDELKRETLRSNQAERERNAAVGRTAFATKQFVRKQMLTGNRRGSVDMVTLQHMRARAIREKAMASAVKR